MSAFANSHPDLRLLIVCGMSKAFRTELKELGADLPSTLFERMTRKCARVETIDVLYASDPDTRNDLPFQDYDGVAWTGSDLTVYDQSRTVASQIELCQTIFKAGVPSFGCCWGLQVAAVAAGGECQKNPKGREIGVARKITLTDAGRLHPFHQGRTTAFDSWSSHGDLVTSLPSGSSVLSGNVYSDVQSAHITFAKGDYWGVQYHPEYDAGSMARLLLARTKMLLEHEIVRSEDDIILYASQLRELHDNPRRADLAWKLGLDQDVLDTVYRLTEFQNWITSLVVPRAIEQRN